MTTTLPFAWAQVSARVSRQIDYGAGFRWLDLEVPAGFTRPTPGQFVQLLLPPPSVVLLPRPMSVAAVSPSRRGAPTTLGFLYAPVGTGTRALAALERGAEVVVLGPLGHGYPLEHPGTPVLVAGGRGVAPLLFAADTLAQGARNGADHGSRNGASHRRRNGRSRGHGGRACEFVFGARSRAQLVGLAEARERLVRSGGRLHLATDDGSRGARGTVVELLERLAPGFEPPLVIHACGPHAMLRAVAVWSLARGISAFLAMESVMACGTGVCRGCPLPRSAAGAARVARRGVDFPSLFGNRDWAMCCTEGPVFSAEELDWDRVE